MDVRTEYENLEVSIEEGVTYATINRPKVLNALNEAVIRDLLELIDQTVFPSASRVLVLSGSGDKAFVAGADISAMGKMSSDEILQFTRMGQELTKALEAAPFVTVASVQGFALGGGCELAMACDITIASENALFGQPEVDLGLIPGFGGTQRLARRVGLPMALDILVGGRKLKGQEAFQVGLVSRVVPQEELEDAVDSTIEAILKASPTAIQETKRLTRESLEMPLAQGLASEATTFAQCFQGHEAKEGISAFLEKRKASFSL
ncbi:enoyl-CoA hydratase/isomerase family protein [Pseudobacteriovorax antillogorgiicola]|uniref:Short chain enoyl-CoA hydratase n=1 Tax=Pseudobacteriovorax antillogorgiicola TaxID=1513793 RepID=A0A1Y6BLC0_9BACT|nr:enoyl-CoA hydratase-related protein [Pseudobacteriovorax antillogorgiicola]TCS55355.1 short chain enoyl-CoA hydratase [Pseudobacteriovorax antillogorgiicola]SMF13721.1 short chain enoyl-CoA hydratase [Pseudobacteriovorax antillogorgiicola]